MLCTRVFTQTTAVAVDGIDGVCRDGICAWNELVEMRGALLPIHLDKGQQFHRQRTGAVGSKQGYRPQSPPLASTRNTYVERFNKIYRTEVLDCRGFDLVSRPADTWSKSMQLFEDRVGGSSPLEWMAVRVVRRYKVIDALHEFFDADERTATDLLVGDLREEAFDLVQPIRRSLCPSST